MNNNRSASLEARIKNSRSLMISIADLDLYNPTSDEIKKENYKAFVNEVDLALTPYKEAGAVLISAKKDARNAFKNLVKISRQIRSEMNEIKGNHSDDSLKTNSVIKLITGENIREHADKKKQVLKSLKEGEKSPSFSSVSALDNKSRLGNFRTLISLLKTYSYYTPTDNTITIAALESLELSLTAALDLVSEKETDYAAERSNVIHLFEGEGSLKDRAKRAKLHIRRKYGLTSPEYRLHTYKKF